MKRTFYVVELTSQPEPMHEMVSPDNLLQLVTTKKPAKRRFDGKTFSRRQQRRPRAKLCVSCTRSSRDVSI